MTADLTDSGWQEWISSACAALGVDARRVDPAAIHRLTSEVAGRFARPMAPVSAFICGLAVAGGQDFEAVAERIAATLPRR